MDTIVDLERLLYRSKERIRSLGEVFTPEQYVDDMLNLLSAGQRGFWANEHIVFFEPCAGHGNIVIAILRRRLEALFRKSITRGVHEAAYFAVANSLNTIWAIDIDAGNIENCRTRMIATVIDFLTAKIGAKAVNAAVRDDRDFFAHTLAAIKWQISENETLSALSAHAAAAAANQTAAGAKWFRSNGHRKIDFEYTWVTHFDSCTERNVVPLEFKRACHFLASPTKHRVRGYDEYRFAKTVLQEVWSATPSPSNQKLKSSSAR